MSASSNTGSKTQKQIAFDVEEAVKTGADLPSIWQAMVTRAVQCRVSDIHLLSQKDSCQLAFRIDGDMHYQGSVASDFSRRLISHVKSQAGMDIAERRRPSEGRMLLEVDDRTTDLRISVVPGIHGLDMVVRVLDHKISLLELTDLGLLHEQLDHINDMLTRSSGLILVSGPTGSGKTTTLYAMLRRLAGHERKVISIEDPVEYDLEGVNQTQVNPRIGVTFGSMLTAILRQDPDIIMVGEIRDQETAMTAVRAANMGNLVLATTHATRASRAVETLLSLGVHPYFLAAALQGVITQVLVKRICNHCRQSMPETADIVMDDAILKRLAPGAVGQLSQGLGCDDCFGTGYHGRMGLYELFLPNEHMKQLILERRPAVEIDKAFAESSWLSLEQVGKLAAVTGQTTMEEIVRVLPNV